MTDILLLLFGHDEDLNAGQMGLRAAVIFLLTFLLIRIAGRRSFGLHTPLDNIIVILLGAIMSRAVVGASSFVPTIFAGFIIALLHRVLATLAVSFHYFGKVVKGSGIMLFQDGKFIKSNMMYCLMSEDDIREEVRLKTQSDSFDQIERIFIERNGKVSIIKK